MAQEKKAQGKNGTGKNGTKCMIGKNGTILFVENRDKQIFQIVYFTDKKNGNGPPKKQKVALEPE